MRAKKHLGQNFLRSKKIVERIALASKLSSDIEILEIGPGKGILTEALLSTGAPVVAIEKDPELIPYLNNKFKTYIETKQLRLIEGDILEISPGTLLSKGKPYQIVANIPYYITGEILRTFLESDVQPISMTVLVQKEVAKRIIASDKKESILSLSVKIYGTPKIVEIVKNTMFTPIPKVDSAVLLIEGISKTVLQTHNITDDTYFYIIKKAFGQKRKQLLSNLKEHKSIEKLRTYFTQHDISPTIRAEDIPCTLWPNIVKILST